VLAKVALVAALTLVAACSASSTKTTNADASGGKQIATQKAAAPKNVALKVFKANTFLVGSVTADQVDTTRKTKACGGVAELPQRTLPVTVFYPADGTPGKETIPNAPGAKDKGPFPLLVFSHGVGAFGTAYAATLTVIASAGYIVAAPTYPLGNNKTPGGATITDIDEQTRDVSFLLDQYVAMSAKSGNPLSGLVDPDRLGAFGHSMGAITSIGVGFNNCCADKRLKAVAEWSGLHLSLDGDDAKAVSPVSKGRPLLVLHGDKDPIVPYPTGQAFYAQAGGPKYFVTLPGQGHITPFVVGLGSPVGSVVTLSTIDFFDRYLKDDAKGIERVKADVAATPGTATMESVEK
jgi:fermentation-respiration switch protein FrsA (DUF1100 family)